MIAAVRPLAPPMTPLGYVGRLFRNTRASGFKLALVVGAGNGDRQRVRFWRANSRCWTNPTLIELEFLQELTPAERAKHRKTIDAAFALAQILGYGVVSS